MELINKTSRIRFDDRKFNTYQKKNTRSFAEASMQKSRNHVPIATGETLDSLKIIETPKGHSVSSINYRSKSNGETYPTGNPGGRMGYTNSGVVRNRNKHHWLSRGRDEASQTWRPVGKMNDCIDVRR